LEGSHDPMTVTTYQNIIFHGYLFIVASMSR